MDRRFLAALALPLALTACSSDDSEEQPSANQEETGPSAPEGTPDGVGDISEADEYAIKETLTGWLLEPRCDLATDDYLIDLAPFADEDTTVEEACDLWTKGFIEVQYQADDITYDNLVGEADRVTIDVGSELISLTTTYELSFVDGRWLVSGDQYNSDHL